MTDDDMIEFGLLVMILILTIFVFLAAVRFYQEFSQPIMEQPFGEISRSWK